MDKFIYDTETRRHTLNGVNIPSVTQVLSPLTDFSMIPLAVLERKTQLGIEFHKAVELHLDGLPGEISVDPAIQLPFETFVAWWQEQPDKDQVLLSEAPVVNKGLGYCGAVDILTRKRLLDIKLRNYDPVKDPLQLAGYAECLAEEYGSIRIRTVVSFDLKGGIKIHDAYHRQAGKMFAVMLERFKTLEKSDKIISGWKAEAMR